MANNGSLQYHIVWCTKYRRKVIINNFAEDLKTEIINICSENKWKILELEIMPDHVHIFINADSKSSVHRIVSQLKGKTSFELRKKHEWLKTKLPCLWTRSYYADSIGNASSETIRQYILNQKKERPNSSPN